MLRLLVQQKMVTDRRWLLKKYSGMLLLVLFQILLSAIALAQTSLISGRVTNESGDPIPRASIIVKGTNGGTTADENGKFAINAPANGTLIVSSIGYLTFEKPIAMQSVINITLTTEKASVGEEVVVVGYGTQRKKDVTGSVVSVSDKTLREVPAANLQQALQGRAAGLEIQKTSTKPGAGAVIRIRGERSIIGANDPLLVVDGIPFEGGNLNDINPNDIASIDILKDASATAIYGSRGANGVILISTKKGRSEEAKVAYNGYYGVSSVARKYPVMNATEYMAMRDISNWTQGYDPIEKINISKGVNTDWQDLMYKNGHNTDHYVTATGGANGSTFSLGGGYYNETTVLPGQEFERFSLRASIDAKIGKKLKIGLNTMNSLGYTNGSQFVNPVWGILAASPLMTSYDSTGKLILSPYGNPDDKAMSYNPVLLQTNNNNWVDRVRRLRTFNSIYGEYQIYKDLKYRLNVGLDFRQQQDAQFRSADSKLKPSYFRVGQGNTASVNNSEGYGYTIENILTYDKQFGKIHRITATGLYSVQQDRSMNTYASKDSIDEDFIQFYNLGLANASNGVKPTVSGSESTWGLISYMLRVNYSLLDRYLLTLTGRIDGSSRLAPGNKYHEYPAISAGWLISNEHFMQNQNLFSMLKLRAGWGETSNQAVRPYSTQGAFTSSNDIYSGTGGIIRYNYGPTIVSGYTIVELPNPNLGWEYTRTFNLGLDFAFLKNRISGSIEYYSAKTSDILYGIALPATSGITRSYTTNMGNMSNKGFEFSISSTNISSASGFTWATDLNLFANRNKLLKLNDGFKQNIASQLFIGEPLSAIYDYTKLGIWQIDEAVEAAKYGRQPGEIKLKDLNNDGRIDDINDRSIIGNSQANLQGGFTNRFNYKGLDFSFVMYARFGGLLISQLHQPQSAYINMLDGKRNNLLVDYWTPTNPTNDFPSPAGMQSSIGVSTLGYYDASFIKMRSINLGYSFDRKLLNRIKANNIRFYLAVQNPFVLYSPYMRKGGVDPEATGTGNQGISNPVKLSSRALTIGLSTPPTRSFILGLNVSL